MRADQYHALVVLSIPTLLEMNALETAQEEASSPSKDAWGWRQRASFLGIVVVLERIGSRRLALPEQSDTPH